LPRLQAGQPFDGQRFAVRVLRPGEHPMQRLAEALACDPDHLDDAIDRLDAASDRLVDLDRLLDEHAHDRLLLFIDQLEELFALADAGERDRFVGAIDSNKSPALRGREPGADKLARAVSTRLALLDTLDGRLTEARTRLGGDARNTDA